MRAIGSIRNRSTLEAIVQSEAPLDVRRVAAERLLGDEHIRLHARRPVREAAAWILESKEILRALADHDSEPVVRAIALSRLGEPSPLSSMMVDPKLEAGVAEIRRADVGSWIVWLCFVPVVGTLVGLLNLLGVDPDWVVSIIH